MKKVVLAFLVCLLTFWAQVTRGNATEHSMAVKYRVYEELAQHKLVSETQKEVMPTISPAALSAAKKKKSSFKEKLGKWILKKAIKKKQRKVRKTKDGRRSHWGNVAGLSAAIGAIVDLVLLGTGLLFFAGAICAIVFGTIGMSNSGEGKEYKGKGMGIAALVLGILEVVLVIAAIAVLFAVFGG